MATYSKKPSQTNGAITLSITFSGPMLFDFDADSALITVDVYVPFCPYHDAGFFFSVGSISETDLWGCANPSGTRPLADRVYSVSSGGIVSNRAKPILITSDFPAGLIPKTITPPESKQIRSRRSDEQPGTGYILQLPSANLKKSTRKRSAIGSGLPAVKRMFQLSVPMPDYVYPLYFDTLQVVDDVSSPPADQRVPHCTSLRFFYAWDGKTPILLNRPDNQQSEITPPLFSLFSSQPDIALRHEGFGLADENDPHSDARSCFASLATMAGTNWWLNYEDGKSTPTNPSQGSSGILPPPSPCDQFKPGHHQSEIHTGGDCHAPVIVNGLGT